jgi:hypothetical protein
MPKSIEFPDTEPGYIFERDCLLFRAVVDGKPVDCFVTGELLMVRFGAQAITGDALREAFLERRAEIEGIARNHIENGWIDEDGRILLTTRFTRLDVSFDERLSEWPDGLAGAKVAIRVLTEIIGPNAEEVSVAVAESGSSEPRRSLTLIIADPSLPFSTRTALAPEERQDPITLRILLAGIWGAVLRARSRKYILMSG